MLTNLDFLQLNSEWCPPSEKARMALYELNCSLYKNDPSGALDLVLNIIYPDKAENENVKRVLVNLYRSLSKLWADLLFSENPLIKNASEHDKNFIDSLIKSTSFWKTSKKVAIDVSRYGNGLYKVRLVDNNVEICAITPRIWFPVISPDDISKVSAHVLGWTFIENNQLFLKIEVHEIGAITHRLFSLNKENNKISQELNIKEIASYANLDIDVNGVEKTGCNDFLVIPVENSMDSETAFGEDDYTDIDPIVTQIQAHITKFGRDLEQQGTIKYGPKHAIDENGNIDKNGYIGLMGGQNADAIPGAITWQVAHEAIRSYIEQLMFFFYVVSETSPAIFNPDVSLGNLSGVAIKRLMQRLLLKSGRLAENFDDSIKRVFNIAAQLQNQALGEFEIGWQDGLVSDMLEKANTASTAILAGTMSKKTGVGYVQELEGNALEKELVQIQKEEKEKSALDLTDIYPPDTEEKDKQEPEKPE